jgi:hypothetical protein
MPRINKKQLAMGMKVEQEHKDVTHGNKKLTKKIAVAHLKEVPDYYSKLKMVENPTSKGKKMAKNPTKMNKIVIKKEKNTKMDKSSKTKSNPDCAIRKGLEEVEKEMGFKNKKTR